MSVQAFVNYYTYFRFYLHAFIYKVQISCKNYIIFEKYLYSTELLAMLSKKTPKYIEQSKKEPTYIRVHD